VFFPLGVLLYWFTSNTWTMFQQLYINKYHPPSRRDSVSVR
jgi:YidC/Oxa1 family membrane protein insertase